MKLKSLLLASVFALFVTYTENTNEINEVEKKAQVNVETVTQDNNKN